MQKFSFVTILTIPFLLFGQFTRAEVNLPAIVSSNMVLQSNTTMAIWGWASANEKITLEASWLNVPLMIKVDTSRQQTAFDALNTGVKWDLNFEDECTGDWMQNWTLDGLKAIVENSNRGMHFRAGPEFKDDAHHAVMWTRQSFEGNIKIEYDYTRTDSETRCVNILYIQATGKDEAPYVKDISKWSELREVPAMRTYYEHMNALHISYAAFPNTSDTNSYVRARRYPKTDKVSFKQTEIPPSYDNDDFFKPGVTYHITVIKTRTQLFFNVDGQDGLKLFSWDLSKVNPITEGRVGLRHMYTRSSIYRNFNIYTNSN